MRLILCHYHFPSFYTFIVLYVSFQIRIIRLKYYHAHAECTLGMVALGVHPTA